MISSLKRPGTRVGADHGFALGLSELGKRDAKHVHLDAGGHERDDGMHVLRDAGCRVQCDCRPDCLDVLRVDAMSSQKVTSRIRAIHLEALIRASVCRGEAHVVEHGAGVKELGIEMQAAALAGERAPVIDAARVVEQQRWLGISDQFGHFTRQFAVADDNPRYWP